jgi:hypothetical protein
MNAIVARYFGLAATVGQYRLYLRSIEFYEGAPLALICEAGPRSVRNVPGSRVPAKVF